MSGIVKDGLGQPISQAYVLLRHTTPSTSESHSQYDFTNENGHFAFAVRHGRAPSDYVLCAHAEGHVRHFRGLTVTGDISVTISLEKGLLVSGVVQNEQENPLTSMRVRALDGTKLVTSASTNSNGEYALNLAPGIYNFEVVPWNLWPRDNRIHNHIFPSSRRVLS